MGDITNLRKWIWFCLKLCHGPSIHGHFHQENDGMRMMRMMRMMMMMVMLMMMIMIMIMMVMMMMMRRKN
jgi:hypothetical protein